MKKTFNISNDREINILYTIDHINFRCLLCIDPVYPIDTITTDDGELVYSFIKDIINENVTIELYDNYKVEFITKNSAHWDPSWDKL